MERRRTRITFFVIATMLTAVVASGALVAARSDKWWWDNLGGPDSSHFSNLDQIRKSNLNQLEVAWFYPHANLGFNPIAAEDLVFVSGRGSSLVALDASTGKEVWIHENIPNLSGRGINYWQSDDGRDRRLLVVTGPFLQAIDARTGKVVLTFGTNGYVDLREGLAARRARRARARVPARSSGTCSSSDPRRAKAGCRRPGISARSTW